MGDTNPYLDLVEPQADPTAAPSGAQTSAVEQANPYAELVEPQVDNEAGLADGLRQAAYSAFAAQPDKQSQVKELSRRMRVPADWVEQNYPAFERDFQVSNFDAKGWLANNPTMADVFRRHQDVAEHVVVDQPMYKLTQFLRNAWTSIDMAAGGEPSVGMDFGVSLAPAEERPETKPLDFSAAPKVEMQKAGSYDKGLLSKFGESYSENKSASDKLGEVGREMLWRGIRGETDAWDLEKRAVDIQSQHQPKSYGEGFLSEMASSAGQVAPSMVQGMEQMGAGGAVGALIGATPGLIARNPQLAVKGALKVGRLGARAGSFVGTMMMEAQSDMVDLVDTRTDAGERVPLRVAAGAALVGGVLKAVLEQGLFELEAKRWGPVGELLASGNYKQAMAKVLTQKGSWQLFKDVSERLAKGNISESFLEESPQEVIGMLEGYVARSMVAGKLQQPDIAGGAAQAVAAGTSAFIGMLPLAPVHAAVNVVQDKVLRRVLPDVERKLIEAKVLSEESAVGQHQANAIMDAAANSPAGRAKPAAMADAVATASGKVGREVTDLYVDPATVQTFFQSANTDVNEGAKQLMGESGPERLQEALATGGKLEVSIEEFQDKWAGHAIAGTLKDKVAVSPVHKTGEQLKQEKESFAASVKDLVAQFDKKDGPDPSPMEQAAMSQMQDDMRRAGRQESEVQKAVTLRRAVLHTLSAREGRTVDELLAQYPLRVNPAQTGPAAEMSLSQSAAPTDNATELSTYYRGLDEEGKLGAYYKDRVTGLLNRRAFDALPTEGKPLVAHVSVEGSKHYNSKGGHPLADKVLRAAARALVKAAPEAAKSGTDFVVRVASAEELAPIIAALQAAPELKGLQVTGTVGKDITEAAGAHDEIKRLAEDAKTRAPRGERPLGVDENEDLARFGEGEAQGALIGDELRQAFAGVPEEFAISTINFEPDTGVLTEDGFRALPQKKWQARLDLNGLKATNQFGKVIGDTLIRSFSTIAAQQFGQAFDFAHFHGDEYAAQADDPALLADFLRHLYHLAEGATVDVPGESGDTFRIKEISFGWGVGRTEDDAERNLNTHKDRLARHGKRGAAADRGRVERLAPGVQGREGASDSVSRRGGLEPREDVLARRARLEEFGNHGRDVRPEGSAKVERFDQSKKEDPKNLLVQHNLTADNLLHADELGGLAAPSLGVARKEHPLESFGEITLLGGPEMADPSETPVFASDAYSPRYPDTHFQVKDSELTNLTRFLAPFVKRTEGYLGDFREKVEADDPRDVIHGSLIQPALQVAWLETEKNQKVPGEGRSAIRDAAEEMVAAAGENEFEEWAEARVAEAQGARLITRRTASGNKRGIPYTLENVLKEVTGKIRQGENFNFGLGSVRAAGTKRFSSLEQIKKARDKVVSPEQFESLKKENDSRFFALTEELQPYYQGDSSFRMIDDVAAAIGESYKRGRSIGAELAYRFKDVPSELVEKVRAFGQDLLAMPTEYFEAKPQRAVRLGEFKAAVVPEGVSPKVLEALKEHGLEVVTYSKSKDGDRRRAIEEAATRKDILFQGTGDERGRVEIVKTAQSKAFNIFLSKADRSTVFHELGHTFLEMMRDLAAKPGASAALKADLEATLKWMGVEKAEDIQREHHEKWARAFEAYLREGKAPSNAMMRAFTRFRLWLTGVYSNATELNVELTDEVREVFERLLATDKEIDRQRRSMGLAPLWQSPVQAGMTPEQWQAYLDEMADVTSHASMQLAHTAVKEQLRESEAWWREELAAEKEKARAAYDGLQVTKAKDYIKKGKLPDAPPNGMMGRLDRKKVEALIGKDRAKAAFGGRLVKEGGEDPKDIAQLFNYPNARQLLEAIELHPTRDEWAREMAEQAMKDKHPGVMDDIGKMRDTAAKGMHGDRTAEWLLREWSELGKKSGSPVPPLAAIKAAAALLVERRAVRRLDAGAALTAERSAAGRAARAAAKGDTSAAYVAKQQQLLNFYLYRELTKAAEERESFQALLANLSDDKRRSKLGLAGKEYLDAVDTILEAVGEIAPELDKGILAERGGLEALVQRLEADMLSPAFDVDLIRRLIADPKPWKSLTFGEMRNVDSALRQIKKAAYDTNHINVEGKRLAVDSLTDAIELEASGLKDQGTQPHSASLATPAYRFKIWLHSFHAAQRETAGLFRRLGSTATRFFWKGYVEARNKEVELSSKVLRFFTQAWEALPEEMQAGRYDIIDASALPIPDDVNLGGERDRQWMWMVALNMGNASNKDRLLGGYQWTDAQVTDFLNKNMTKEEWDFVQSIWTLLDRELYPHMAEAYEKVNGIKPHKIEATQVITPFGVLTGGYFPARYSPVDSRVGRKQAESALQNIFGGNSVPASVAKSFTKERAKNYSDIILLDWNVMPGHVLETIHYAAFNSFVRDAARIIGNSSFNSTVVRRLGLPYRDNIEGWLKAVASVHSDSVAKELGVFYRALSSGKARMVGRALGWNIANALGDLSNPLVAAAAGKVSAASMLRAYGSSLVGGLPAMRREALAKSPEMRMRSDESTAELKRKIGEIGAAGKRTRIGDAIARAQETKFFFQHTIGKLVDPIVWHGAFADALAADPDEGRAIQHADEMLRQATPSHEAGERAPVLRDKHGIGQLIAFQGFFNKLYNMESDVISKALDQWDDAEGKADKLRAGAQAGRTLAILVMAGAIGELFTLKHPEEETPEGWAEWAALQSISAFGAMFGIFGAGITTAGTKLLKLVEGKTMQPVSARLAPPLAGMDSLRQALDQAVHKGGDAGDKVLDVLEALLVAADLPSGAPVRSARYLKAVGAGDHEPEGVMDVVRGVAGTKRVDRGE
jgi:GGDEF domain-containing protein